jgi:phage major head subunit gpT-like protein
VIINENTLTTLFTMFNDALARGLEMADVSWQNWAMTITSGQSLERYPMLVLLSTMREWIGPRQFNSFKAQYLQVINRDFEHSIAVPTNTIEDDQLGLFPVAFQQMGMDATQLWPDIGTDALIANAEWLDGTAFFAAARTLNGNTINNYTTDALSATTFTTAYDLMIAYAGYNGKPLGVKPMYLMVGPSNRTVAHGIVNTAAGGATAVNANEGLVEIIINPYLIGDYSEYWYILADRGAVKPVLMQQRKMGALIALDKPTDATVFLGTTGGEDGNIPGGVNAYGIHYRGEAALTLPPLAYGGFAT